MKKKLLVLTKAVMITMGVVGITYADQPNWTGFYTGASGSLAFINVRLKSQHLGFTNFSETCNRCSDFLTFSSGIQIGYMHQFYNTLVSGIEANVAFNHSQKYIFNCNSEFNSAIYDRLTFRNPMQTSIKGRIGRVQHWNKNNLLPYLTAGASIARIGLSYENEGSAYYSHATNHMGWLIGAGVEWAFIQHWSLRAEYNFVDYGKAKLNIPIISHLYDRNGHANVDLSSHNFVVAINYWI